ADGTLRVQKQSMAVQVRNEGSWSATRVEACDQARTIERLARVSKYVEGNDMFCIA
ncbi:glucose-1-phosphate cytidylyltransferase, partial [Burkholderia pseudomallei]